MKAAVPQYMRDMQQAAPGHRFGMYFPIWNEQWEMVKDKKTDAIKKVLALHPDDQRQHSLAQRQHSLAQRQQFQALTLGDSVYSEYAIATAPFATGMGYEHPLENGFAFLNPYGLPYLPGSSVKGVMLRAAEELKVDVGVVDELFGSRSDDDSQGALNFWDVFPQGKLALDIMTPHHSAYLQEGIASPHDSESPNPIPFLTVAPGAQFAFHVQMIRPTGILDWQVMLKQCFEHVFDWLGFGSKTAVGYGAMAVDEQAQQEEEAVREAVCEQQKQVSAEREQAARLAAMTPGQRELALLHQSESRWGNNGTFLQDMEQYLEEHDMIMPEVASYLCDWMEKKYRGIMANPDAVMGKKHKPKFKQRPKKIAKALSEKRS